jgi:hypothetical protein
MEQISIRLAWCHREARFARPSNLYQKSVRPAEIASLVPNVASSGDGMK